MPEYRPTHAEVLAQIEQEFRAQIEHLRIHRSALVHANRLADRFKPGSWATRGEETTAEVAWAFGFETFNCPALHIYLGSNETRSLQDIYVELSRPLSSVGFLINYEMITHQEPFKRTVFPFEFSHDKNIRIVVILWDKGEQGDQPIPSTGEQNGQPIL